MQVAYRAHNLIDAHLARHVLEDAGIPWKIYHPSFLGATGKYLGLAQYPIWDPALYDPTLNPLVMLVAEALAVAACAFLVAGIAFLILAPLADTLIAAVEIIDGPICRLAPGQFLLLFAVTVLAGGLGALIGGARVLAIEPAECLREA